MVAWRQNPRRPTSSVRSADGTSTDRTCSRSTSRRSTTSTCDSAERRLLRGTGAAAPSGPATERDRRAELVWPAIRASGTSDRAEAIASVSDVDLSHRTVLVTESTDGIGREVSLAPSRLGATVLVHGRDRGKGRTVVDRIDASAGEAALLVADLADLDEVRGLAGTASESAPSASAA